MYKPKAKLVVVMVLLANLSGCLTIGALNVLSDATCTTEIGKKDSRFLCEFEGEKVFSKK